MKKENISLVVCLQIQVLLVTGALTDAVVQANLVCPKETEHSRQKKTGQKKRKLEDRRTEVSEDDAVKICHRFLMFTIIKVDINYWMCMMTDSI